MNQTTKYIFFIGIFFLKFTLAQAQKADSLITKANNESDSHYKGLLYLEAAKSFYAEKKLANEALIIAQYAYDIAEQTNNDLLRMMFYDMEGYLYRKENKFSYSIRSHKKAIEIGEKYNFQEKLPKIYNNIAVAYRRIDDHEKAIKNHTKALNLARKLGQNQVALYAINGLGNSYIAIKKYNEAIKYFTEALEIARKEKNMLSQAINFNNIGEAYQMMEQYTRAQVFYQKSLDINLKIKNQTGIAISYNSLGKIYQYQKKFEQALKFFKQALDLNKKTKNDFYIAVSLLNMADINIRIKQTQKAQEYLTQANEITKGLKSKSLNKNVNELWKDYYLLKKDYKTAMQFQDKAIAYNDSMINEKYLKQIAFYSQQFEMQEKDNQIFVLQKEQQNQAIKNRARTMMILGSGVTLIIAIIALFFYRQNKQEKKNKETLTHKNKEIEHTNKMLIAENEEKTKIARELETSLADKLELIGEIHHRVKNNLAIISAIFQLEEMMTDNENEKFLLNQNAKRIKTMAIIQEILYESKSHSIINIQEFLNTFFEFIRKKDQIANKINFEFSIHSPIFKLNLAVPFGLLINELVNLGIKILSKKKPDSVTIKFDQFETYFVLTYRELFNEPDQIGEYELNQMLIETLTQQLNGTIETKKTTFKRLITIEFENKNNS